MIENRLCLNKKPIYELPDDVLIGFYNKYNDVERCLIPKFEPDICLNTWGNMSISTKKESSRQIWVKTKNKELLDFIRNNDWSKYLKYTTYKYINIWLFKKIILEEFYNKNNS